MGRLSLPFRIFEPRSHTLSARKVQKDGLLKTELAGSVPIDREYRALALSKSLQSLEGEGEGP